MTNKFFYEGPLRYAQESLSHWTLQDALLNHCLKNGLTKYRVDRTATVRDFWAFIEGLPVGFAFVGEEYNTNGRAPTQLLGVFENDLIFVHNNSGKTKNAEITVNVSTVSKERLGVYRQYLKTQMKKTVSRGRVYVIATDDQGKPSLRELGPAGTAFLEDNYEAGVVAATKHVAEDLRSSRPCGRISILDGAPGCGKTYLLRSLFRLVPNAYFVLVPPALVQGMTGPDLMNVLLSLRYMNSSSLRPYSGPESGPEEDTKAKPAVLVLEDADEVLVPRGSDNMPAISTLLNFSDGIMGSCVDLRILATTNSRFEDMDAALLRHGRLCRRVKVEALSVAQAYKVFSRLVGNDAVPSLPGMQPGRGPSGWDLAPTAPMTLADVYYWASIARGDKPADGDNRDSGASLGGASLGFASGPA